MMTRLLCVLLGLYAMPCWSADAADELMARLKVMLPSSQISTVLATPIDGLFEVTMGRNVAFTNASGRYFVFGHMFDMQTLRDLTADRPGPDDVGASQ